MSDNTEELSQVEEIQTESTTVKNESSTPENDVIESATEPTQEHIPLARLNKEVFKKHEAKREADALRIQNAELQAKLDSQPQLLAKKPDMFDEDIDHDQDIYNEKLLDWKLDQRDAKRQSDQAKKKQVQSSNDLKNAFDVKANAYAIENPDYVKAIENSNGLTYDDDVQSVILQSDQGAKIDHYLLTNVSELDKMSTMNTYQKMKHLGKIEDSFTKQKEIKQSNASAPIDTVKGGALVATENYKYLDGATFE